LSVQPELQIFVVFIEFSASVRVSNAVLMTVSPVGFTAKGHPKNPGFVTRMTEQRLVDESCTTQYSSPNAASAGAVSTARPKAQIIAFFIRSSKFAERIQVRSKPGAATT